MRTHWLKSLICLLFLALPVHAQEGEDFVPDGVEALPEGEAPAEWVAPPEEERPEEEPAPEEPAPEEPAPEEPAPDEPAPEEPRPEEPPPEEPRPEEPRPEDSLDGALRAALRAALGQIADLDAGPIQRFLRFAPIDMGYAAVGVAPTLKHDVGAPPGAAHLAERATASLGPYEGLALDLSLLDIELPGRFSLDELAALAERTATEQAALDACEVADPKKCQAEYRTLSAALVTDPVVSRRFFLLLGVRMALFPRGYLQRAGVMARTPLLILVHERVGCLQRPGKPCEFLGSVVAIEQFRENATSFLEEFRDEIVKAGNPWPADEETQQRLYDRERSFAIRLPFKGTDDVRTTCYRAPMVSVDVLHALHDCMDREARKSVAANPSYLDPERLRSIYERIRDQRGARLAAKHQAALLRHLELLAISIGALLVLGVAWCLARRFGLVAAGAVSVALLAIGGTMAVTYVVRYGVESVFSAGTSTRVHLATFETLMSDDMRALISRKTEDGMDLVRGPLFDLTPLGDAEAEQVAEVPLLPHLLERWSRLVGPLAERAAIQQGGAVAAATVYDTVLGEARMLAWIGVAYVGLQGLLFAFPHLLMLLLVLLYMKPLRAQLIGLADPATDPAGEGRGPRLKRLLRGELRSLALFLPILAILLPVIGELLSATLGPVIRLFLGTALRSVSHLTEPGQSPSGLAILVALGLVLVLLAACVALYVAAFVVFSGKWRILVRGSAHDGRPLRAQRTFWTRTLPGFGWVLLAPWLLTAGLVFAVNALTTADHVSALDLVVWPAATLAAFLVLLWLARVGKLLGAVRRYAPVPAAP